MLRAVWVVTIHYLRQAIPGNDSSARKKSALQLVPLLIRQSPAIRLAHRPAASAASRIDIVASFAAADANPLIRVGWWSPDQRRLWEDHVSWHQVSGRQQVASEHGVVTYFPTATRGLMTRPVLRLVQFVAVKFSSAAAAFQHGIFAAHRAYAIFRSTLHDQLISEIIAEIEI